MSESDLARAVKRVGVPQLLASFSPDEWAAIQQTWALWARPDQLEPAGDWRVWLVLAGRGWGKSRVGAETVRKWALDYPGCHIALVARTAADARDVMVRALTSAWRGGYIDPQSEGWPTYEPSKRSLSWKNGSRATTYSAEEPNQLRGPQHDFAWADELAAWPAGITPSRQAREVAARSVMEEMWHDGLMMGLRGSGECRAPVDRPRCIVTTTPRPRPLIRQLLKDRSVCVTKGSTFDNAANLPAQYVADIRGRYDGTRLGRQELHAELLDDVLGALWTYAMIDDHRVEKAPDMVRVGIGVDPSGTSEAGNEQGILVCGVGTDGHGYVLDDLSTHDSPDGWGRRIVRGYVEHRADFVAVERNYGGDMVASTIQQAAKSLGVQVHVKEVVATRGKIVRAEPISALYEQGRVHHVGEWPELEEQMRNYVPKGGTSPDRMDAMVWCFTKLMLGDMVTLGDGPVAAGERRATARNSHDEDDFEEGGGSRWR